MTLLKDISEAGSVRVANCGAGLTLSTCGLGEETPDRRSVVRPEGRLRTVGGRTQSSFCAVGFFYRADIQLTKLESNLRKA
jgi:hypothetical protein